MSTEDTRPQEGTSPEIESEVEAMMSAPDEGIDYKAEAERNKEIARQAIARAKRAEKEAKEARSQTIDNTRPGKHPVDDEYGELRYDGYDKEESTFILNNGGREALKDPNSYVAIAINTKREQKRAEEAASRTQDTSQMTEVERKYTTDQLKNMPIEELEKVLPHA